MSTPNARHSGSQPSPGCHSRRRDGSASAADGGVVRLVTSDRDVGVVEEIRFHRHGGDRIPHRPPARDWFVAPVTHADKDRLARALPPRLRAVACREQDDRFRVLGREFAPQRACGPVDGRVVVGEHRVPVDCVASRGGFPDRRVLGTPEHLDHVVTASAEQTLERRLQRKRARPAQSRANNSKFHARQSVRVKRSRAFVPGRRGSGPGRSRTRRRTRSPVAGRVQP